jgi:hypothetical protein
MRSLLAIAVVFALGGIASADKVDWSQYLEKPGEAPPKHKSVDQPAPKEKAPPKAAATTKPKAKAPAASAKAKPRRK